MTRPGEASTDPPAPEGRPSRDRKRTFRWQRWTGVALRALHLVAVIALGASLHGAAAADLPLPAGQLGGLVLASGLLMFALDVFSFPQHLREVAGWSVLVKLALVAALVASGSLAVFWLIVAWSAVFSHAPASFRHRVLFPRRPLVADRR